MGCYGKYLWKISLIFGKIKLFLEKKDHRKPYNVRKHTHVCVATHTHAYGMCTNAWTYVRN